MGQDQRRRGDQHDGDLAHPRREPLAAEARERGQRQGGEGQVQQLGGRRAAQQQAQRVEHLEGEGEGGVVVVRQDVDVALRGVDLRCGEVVGQLVVARGRGQRDDHQAEPEPGEEHRQRPLGPPPRPPAPAPGALAPLAAQRPEAQQQPDDDQGDRRAQADRAQQADDQDQVGQHAEPEPEAPDGALEPAAEPQAGRAREQRGAVAVGRGEDQQRTDHTHRQTASTAARMAATFSFCWFSMAVKAAAERAGSGSKRRSDMPGGTTCQATPKRSATQPQAIAAPSAFRASKTWSASSWLSHSRASEMAGVKGNCGPALSAWMRWPQTSNSSSEGASPPPGSGRAQRWRRRVSGSVRQ